MRRRKKSSLRRNPTTRAIASVQASIGGGRDIMVEQPDGRVFGIEARRGWPLPEGATFTKVTAWTAASDRARANDGLVVAILRADGSIEWPRWSLPVDQAKLRDRMLDDYPSQVDRLVELLFDDRLRPAPPSESDDRLYEIDWEPG